MRLVFDRTNMAEMLQTGPQIERVRIGVDQRFGRLQRPGSDRRPFAASKLGFEEAISQHRYHRDRIEDEDLQHHDVDQIDVELIEGNGDHQLQTYPVKQGQRPGHFCIPWAPEPVGSARRRRWRGGLFWCRVELINILHLQSLSIAENSTASIGVEPADHREDAPIVRGKPVSILPPSSFPSSLRPDLRSGSGTGRNSGSERKPQ